jgi:hypothetical protein
LFLRERRTGLSALVVSIIKGSDPIEDIVFIW